MAYIIALFGFFAFSQGLLILTCPAIGSGFFRDWDTLKLEIVRSIVAIVLLAYAWNTQSIFLFLAGSIVTLATVYFAFMKRSPKGHKKVQTYLVESESGSRAYALFAIIPMAILILLGVFPQLPKFF